MRATVFYSISRFIFFFILDQKNFVGTPSLLFDRSFSNELLKWEQDLPGFFTGWCAVATVTSGFVSAPVWYKVKRKVGEGGELNTRLERLGELVKWPSFEEVRHIKEPWLLLPLLTRNLKPGCGSWSHCELGDVFIKAANKRLRLKAWGYAFKHTPSVPITPQFQWSLVHQQGSEQTPSFPQHPCWAWGPLLLSFAAPQGFKLEIAASQGFYNEPQQAEWAMDSRAAGGLISLAISTNQKKPAFFFHFSCFTHPWQLGFPMLHLGPCPWRAGSAGAGHQAAMLSLWAWSLLPALGWDRQAFVCLEPAKPGCDCELESDLSWAPAPVRKKNEQTWGVFSNLKCQFRLPHNGTVPRQLWSTPALWGPNLRLDDGTVFLCLKAWPTLSLEGIQASWGSCQGSELGNLEQNHYSQIPLALVVWAKGVWVHTHTHTHVWHIIGTKTQSQWPWLWKSVISNFETHPHAGLL